MKELTVKEYIEKFRPELTFTNLLFSKEGIVIVVEVPHQRKVSSLYYKDDEEYERAYLGSVVETDASGGIADTAEYMGRDESDREVIEAYAGHDLHNWRKLVGIDEVLSFIPAAHQRLEVWRAITSNLLDQGILGD